MINIKDRTNRIINIIKAKYGFKDKSQTIDFIVEEYEKNFLEPELKPEYKRKLKKILDEKHYTQEEMKKILEE